MPDNLPSSKLTKQDNNKQFNKNFDFFDPNSRWGFLLCVPTSGSENPLVFIILFPILLILWPIVSILISFVLSCIDLFLKCLYVDICTVFSKNPCQLLKSPEFYLILSLIGVLALLTSNPVGWGMTALLISALIAAFIYTIISKCLIPSPPVGQITQDANSTSVQQASEETKQVVEPNL